MRRPTPLSVPLLLLATAAAQDPARDLRSRDHAVRLAALDTVRTTGDAGATKQVIRALKDKDWEVRERAAAVLGALRAPAAVDALVDASIDGVTDRLRRTAARALAAIDPVAAAAELEPKTAGRKALAALEALAAVLHAHPDPAAATEVVGKTLDKMQRHKEPALRAAARRAAFPLAADRGKALEELVERDVEGACAALDAMRATPRPDNLPLLRGFLAGPGRKGVVERRLRAAAVAACLVAADKQAAAKTLVDALTGFGPPQLRRARLTATLHAAGALDHDRAIAVLSAVLESPEPQARAAAARALRDVGGAAAGAVATAAFATESEGHVRTQLVETAVATLGTDATARVAWLAERLDDPHPWVRERAAVALGRSGLDAAVPALRKALEDARWPVAACAAVSLGKTRADAAIAPLLARAKDPDWRTRGAAVVGLMHLNRKESVAPLIAALADDVALVARSAHEGLERIADLQMPMDAKKWRAFWDERLDSFVFRDWQQIEENRKKYGYGVADRDIYRGLDVIVFQSRGDHIERLLEKLEIEHRKTETGAVHDAGPHPGAICIVNCTGEMAARDREALRWFVMTGGALFGSCWALSQTIDQIYPGVMGKASTGHEVLDDVRAYPCHESAFLTGVFPAGVRPIYHLEGAHLIRVDDPERTEVLIDSPECAARHGSGNLAAWFRAGHGLVMDSVNHFDLQGLLAAGDLRKPDERQAYAIDHMALDYERWRQVRRAGWWRSAERAAAEVPDLSAFRFLTNFVRAVRIGIDGQ